MSLSESVRDLQVALSTVVNLEKELNDKKLVDIIISIVKTAKKGVTDATGGALQILHKSTSSINAVKKLVQGNPDSLSFKNELDRLPVQTAVWNLNSVKYIPILAKVGIDHNAGGRGMRGGLLVTDPTAKHNRNTLQHLAHLGNASDPIPCDTASLDAWKELRKDNLLLKGDIWEHDLLYQSCHPQSKKRFEYLAEWNPDCLATVTFEDLPLVHDIIKNNASLISFTIYFQSALKHHPQHLGFLFQKDDSGQTAYERAIEKHGKQKTSKVIRQCIPTDTELPILHHVVKDVPQFMNDFTICYPSAIYLRDECGRSFTQCQLTEGKKNFANDGTFFLRMTDDEIAELDPVTKQYPFLTCAAGETSDLLTIYVLLSRNPSLLEKYIGQTTDEFAEEARSRKRIRDSDNENDGEDEE